MTKFWNLYLFERRGWQLQGVDQKSLRAVFRYRWSR